MEELIEYKTSGDPKDHYIATITLQQPVFSIPLGQALLESLDKAEQDPGIRVIILTGKKNIFCAGANLKNTANSLGTDSRTINANSGGNSSAENQQATEPGAKVAMRILACAKPVIAAVNGHAIGMGACLLLPCTLRIGVLNSKVGFVFSQRGLSPVALSSFLLPKIVGRSKSLEWVCTGRIFTAKDVSFSAIFTEADSGLFNYLEANAEQVLQRAYQIAREIRQNTSPLSVAVCKYIFDNPSQNIAQTQHREQLAFLEMTQRPDFIEGVQSFVEKRSPSFPPLSDFTPLKSKL